MQSLQLARDTRGEGAWPRRLASSIFAEAAAGRLAELDFGWGKTDIPA